MSSPPTATSTPTPALNNSWLSEELLPQILEHLDDRDLLRLAVISKHFHDLALLSYLRRYDITEEDVANNSFPQISTSGAFPALCIGRFITRLDALDLRFDAGTTVDRDLRALQSLAHRLPPIKSVDMQFIARPISPIEPFDIEDLVFTLLSPYGARPVVTVSPFMVTIIRPPSFTPAKGLQRIISPLKRIVGANKKPAADSAVIQRDQFREARILFLFPTTLFGALSTISIRALDTEASSALGSLVVFRGHSIANLRLPGYFSLAETSLLFESLTLPLLRAVEMAFPAIPYASTAGFLSRHPTLERITVQGPYHQSFERIAQTPTDDAHLPSDALPHLEYMLGTAPFLAWILSPRHGNPLANLTTIALELHEHQGKWEAYTAALHSLSAHPNIQSLAILVYEWFPWCSAPERFKAAKLQSTPAEPEQAVHNISDLRVTFKLPHLAFFVTRVVPLAGWVRLWPAVRELSLFVFLPEVETAAAVERECPGIRVTVHHLKRECTYIRVYEISYLQNRTPPLGLTLRGRRNYSKIL
ncbi:hypothetical protein FB45DRAFT_1004629 [Roridomyces roridus]|uniref:F-box domain-containing protein n=1 Tax=Roridomyces roridus TaxID=1738132 RepID=A0AAD7BPX4_9AGAR|nr:hypothetical protein FB45DRAFT_1004629 [Roridomyces roridus]